MKPDTQYTEYDLRQATHLVWRNLPGVPTTFGPCDCGRAAGRGCGPCLVCAEEAVARIAGTDRAHEYVEVVQHVCRLEAAMEEALSP